jgi:hypothetical protein
MAPGRYSPSWIYGMPEKECLTAFRAHDDRVDEDPAMTTMESP